MAHPKAPEFLFGFGSPPIEGLFQKRYKRFFADVSLPDGSVVTAHCPNTGSMKGLLVPGAGALLTPARDPARKLRYTLEALKIGRTWVCVNTHRANQVAEHLLRHGKLREFSNCSSVTREVPFGAGTRFDFKVEQAENTASFIEVKSVTLSDKPKFARFPDAVTQRGQKHLQELIRCTTFHLGACLLFLCMRADCANFEAAADLDPDYAAGLHAAKKAGVRILCYAIQITRRGFSLLPNKLSVSFP